MYIGDDLFWPTSIVITLSVITLAVVRSYDGRKLDPREPPVVIPTIPYIGHLLGMLVYGSRYFKSVGAGRGLPIFTLPTLNSRTYIVTDPNLAAAVQRASKALSFDPIIPAVTQRVLGFDDKTISLMKSDMEHGFVQEIQALVHSRLSPGESLDALTLDAGNEFLQHLNTYREGLRQSGTMRTEDFLEWVKRAVTMATANFLYGPENPIQRDPQLAARFWSFDAGLPKLLVGLLPSLTARAAFQGREELVRELHDFTTTEAYQRAPQLTQDRGEIAFQHGVDRSNIARSDLSFLFAGIVNTSLSSFWLLLNIFAHDVLLSEIRQEVERTLRLDPNDAEVRTMSIKRVVRECPLLVSAFRETLRLYSDNFSTRMVLEDTILAETYFLRKGSIVQISGGIMHTQERIWGHNAHEFDARRFLPRNGGEKARSFHPAAFRAFGGGATLCPGRHFALNEIVAFVAMVVLMFDVTSTQETPLQLPRKQDDVVPIHVLEPAHRIFVGMQTRDKWADVRLEIET